jgi:CMP-N,N'-diacetyllegionaminic acid synthase
LKVLIIGYGSIGKRHEEVLNKLNIVSSIEIVSKQNLTEKTCFKDLYTVAHLDEYDYFVIASETFKHFEQLKYLEENLREKIIFCEKPLFGSKMDLDIIKNRVAVGYVLRFHPLLQKLKKLVENEKVLSVHINTGQYLPTWRQNSDYTKSYSAHKNQGGGVLLDLSHEIDYVQWIFGRIVELRSYQAKISSLDIDSDDLTTFIGKTHDGIIVNISIDYISKIIRRSMIVDTDEASYELDFVANTLLRINQHGIKDMYNSPKLERNDLYISMHQSILNHIGDFCTYNEAKNVMKTISTIQEQNNAQTFM